MTGDKLDLSKYNTLPAAVGRLMDDGPGVYLGEIHQFKAMQEKVEEVLPVVAEKSGGNSGTWSMEWGQPFVDELKGFKTLEELKKSDSFRYGFAFRKFETEWKAVKDAEALGITLLGHELPKADDAASAKFRAETRLEVARQEYTAFIKALPDFMQEAANMNDPQKLPLIQAWVDANPEKFNALLMKGEAIRIAERQMAAAEKAAAYFRSPAGIIERERYAAEYIKEHAKGKKLVTGGLIHSRNYKMGDRSSEAGIGYENRQYDPLAAVGERAPGLATLLGLTSIDYLMNDDITQMGKIIQGDGKSADYNLVLPRTLPPKKLGK